MIVELNFEKEWANFNSNFGWGRSIGNFYEPIFKFINDWSTSNQINVMVTINKRDTDILFLDFDNDHEALLFKLVWDYGNIEYDR